MAFELALRVSDDLIYRAGSGLAIAATFLLVWVNLAVGFIGDTADPANLMFAGVILVAVIGAIIARLRPAGMAEDDDPGGDPGGDSRRPGRDGFPGAEQPAGGPAGRQRGVRRHVADFSLAIQGGGAAGSFTRCATRCRLLSRSF